MKLTPPAILRASQIKAKCRLWFHRPKWLLFVLFRFVKNDSYEIWHCSGILPKSQGPSYCYVIIALNSEPYWFSFIYNWGLSCGLLDKSYHEENGYFKFPNILYFLYCSLFETIKRIHKRLPEIYVVVIFVLLTNFGDMFVGLFSK